MPKSNQHPDSDRRQTRATNATAHPGNMVKDVLAVWRKKEDMATNDRAEETKFPRRQTEGT